MRHALGDSAEGLEPDELARELIKLLDQKDPGARVDVKDAPDALQTAQAKLNSLLTLQTVVKLLRFVRNNCAQGLNFEFTPAYQTMAQELREALLNNGAISKTTMQALTDTLLIVFT